MFGNLSNVLERFVVGVDAEIGGPEVAAERFDGPNDAPSFKVEGGPGTFVVEGGAADENDGADGAVRLLLLEHGAEAIAAGVTVQAEASGIVGNGILVWVDQDRRGGEVVEKLLDDGFHGWGKDELDSLFEEGVDGAEQGEHVGDDLSVVAYAAEEGSELFDVGGHRNFGEGGDRVGVRANASGGNGVSQEVGVGGAKFGFGGRKFLVVLA